MHALLRSALVAALGLASSCSQVKSGEKPPEEAPAPARTAFRMPSEGQRHLVLVSDFHMGLGCKKNGECHPTEDFRWPEALSAFLKEIGRRGENKVDLVIVGDFLELWQPPADVTCEGYDDDHGCTVDELVTITKTVVDAHQVEMSALREFALQGENRLHIIPGNHDSAFVLARVWEPVAWALGADSGRVNLVENGIWVSKDGRIVVEHGHQVGSDANAYETWPNIVSRAPDGRYYVVRPWGEQFVQKLFNAEEKEYPIIDNLSPETTGARYRMADRGIWRSIRDVARFIAFNLFETSLSQKAQILGPEQDQAGKPQWEVRVGREMGHRLFTNALPPDDPFRIALLDTASEEAASLRKELDAVAKNEKRLPEQDVRSLCEMIAMRGGPLCAHATAGKIFESLLRSRESVLRAHLLGRWKDYPSMRVFIYGHTHQLETKWELRLEGNKLVSILNTGAFQRVVDEAGFKTRLEAKAKDLRRPIKPSEALRLIRHDDLPACYTVVEVPYMDERPAPVTRRWFMPKGQGGRFVEVGDPACE